MALVRSALVDAHFNRAVLYETQNRFREAIQEWNKAIEYASADGKADVEKRRDAAAAKIESATSD